MTASCSAVETDQSPRAGTSTSTSGMMSVSQRREYNDFVAYVMEQLPAKKKKIVAAKYQLLQNGKGKILL